MPARSANYLPASKVKTPPVACTFGVVSGGKKQARSSTCSFGIVQYSALQARLLVLGQGQVISFCRSYHVHLPQKLPVALAEKRFVHMRGQHPESGKSHEGIHIDVAPVPNVQNPSQTPCTVSESHDLRSESDS